MKGDTFPREIKVNILWFPSLYTRLLICYYGRDFKIIINPQKKQKKISILNHIRPSAFHFHRAASKRGSLKQKNSFQRNRLINIYTARRELYRPKTTCASPHCGRPIGERHLACKDTHPLEVSIKYCLNGPMRILKLISKENKMGKQMHYKNKIGRRTIFKISGYLIFI